MDWGPKTTEEKESVNSVERGMTGERVLKYGGGMGPGR